MIIPVKTGQKSEFIDITRDVEKAAAGMGLKNGFVHVFSMHTTAAITINESADPAVKTDMVAFLNKAVPWNDNYRHMEGNSAAHVKTSLMGPSEWIPVENGRLVLGTWQGIFFCEFDGPRSRKVYVSSLPTP